MCHKCLTGWFQSLWQQLKSTTHCYAKELHDWQERRWSLVYERKSSLASDIISLSLFIGLLTS